VPENPADILAFADYVTALQVFEAAATEDPRDCATVTALMPAYTADARFETLPFGRAELLYQLFACAFDAKAYGVAMTALEDYAAVAGNYAGWALQAQFLVALELKNVDTARARLN